MSDIIVSCELVREFDSRLAMGNARFFQTKVRYQHLQCSCLLLARWGRMGEAGTSPAKSLHLTTITLSTVYVLEYPNDPAQYSPWLSIYTRPNSFNRL